MIISSEKFVPHTLEHLTEVRAFWPPLPEKFYFGMLENYEQLQDVKTDRIIYESDGLKITGISCLPTKTEAKKHPIYIYNRGGTREFGKLTLLSVMRSILPFTRAGYLAYASNYRGNDGSEGMEEFGGTDVNDVVNLIETAKQNPSWDGKNIFMMGHSRGGMMTYMTLRRVKDINAAIVIAGVADIFEGAKQRPDMESNVFQKYITTDEKNRADEYKKRSVIFWADEITTPLLLQHGTSDDRVDISHSVILDKKLSELDKPHELVIYEKGNHALVSQWSEVLQKSIAWFERFRK